VPYASKAQQRFFNAQRGKAISESTVDEWNDASRGAMKGKPDKVKPKGGGAARWARRRAAS
jgi:hypothetical protein